MVKPQTSLDGLYEYTETLLQIPSNILYLLYYLGIVVRVVRSKRLVDSQMGLDIMYEYTETLLQIPSNILYLSYYSGIVARVVKSRIG